MIAANVNRQYKQRKSVKQNRVSDNVSDNRVHKNTRGTKNNNNVTSLLCNKASLYV